jgi:MFS family permease
MDQPDQSDLVGSRARWSPREYFALNRTVLAAAGSVGLMSLSESLWRRFLPKYLQALGAPIAAIGFFGTTEDFLDGVYQYPGGWIGDRFGSRAALVGFICAAAAGYLAYWRAPTWQWIFAGQLLVMAWSSMASPALFAVIGEALPPHQRAMGFTVQSIVKRVSIAIAPTIGGLVIAAWGITDGMRALLLVSVALAGVAAIASSCIRIGTVARGRVTLAGVWRSLPPELRRLLLSDVFIRTCDGMVDVFLVLYATNVIGISAPRFGVLLAVQAVTAIAVYIPVSRISDRGRRKPFVTATFLFFAAFPIAVVFARSVWALMLAFVIGGLREIGEPSRKAMIVGLAQPAIRARSVGLYYLIRSVAISPAAFIGGLLWNVSPGVPFGVAGAFGLIGAIVFVATVEERHAS